MSLQHLHNTPFALASFSLIQFGSVIADNLGGLDSDGSDSENNNNESSPKDKTTATKNTKADHDTTQNTDTATNINTNTNKATDTATGKIDTTQQTSPKTETNTATTATNTDKVTYNQWGFTGSQKVWAEETKTITSASSESSSASHSTHSVKGNKTSDANRISDKIVGYESSKWKKTLLIASVVGISACIGAL